MTQVSPLPPVPGALRRRHRVLEVSGWSAVVGVLSFAGAAWGPDELRATLVVLVAVTAAVTGLHAIARPALLRWANPARDLDLPDETLALLDGTAVTSLGVATGTVSEGGEESDDLRLRVGSRVLLAPVAADADPRRLAALALTAPTADRGVTAPTMLWAATAVLAGLDGRGAELAIAALLAGAFVGLGVWHAWRTRWPDDALLERMGADAILYCHLLLGLTVTARNARTDPEDADDLWRTWLEAARDPAARTDGLSADDVDAELDRLPSWDG